MYDRFKELGIPVTLTRDTDITLTPNERVQKILNAYGNNPNVIVISNHLNAGGGTCAEVIYALRNYDTLAKNILNNLGMEGQTTRKVYQRRLPSDLNKDYYFIHRNTGQTEPLIIEYGFIDDKPVNVRFLNDNYKRLAEAVIRAVAEYKGINYVASSSIPSNTYVVKKGDTLYSIASKYNTTINELKSLNSLVSDTLRIGQILRVPSPEEDTPTENTYIVKRGDTLYSIASRFNTSIEEIKKINNLTSNTLQIGQILKLKEETELSPNTYTIQKGDSLYAIARRYNTTVDKLKELNNLDTNNLQIGQVLIINNDEIEPTNPKLYTVKKGDNLYSIAKKYNT
ncbi:MAG: LysM peptidoglycan-binding domain-containing protein, partial [Romboutsia sp.]|nr:LysM peptidoglycan-binding domain-containing protein [Romboutsia sp.]